MLWLEAPGQPERVRIASSALALPATRRRPKLPLRLSVPGAVRRVPAPLAALMVIATVEVFAWALFNPALQAGDESGHLAYVQKLVDAHVLPWPNHRRLARDNGASISTELGVFETWSGLEPLRGNLAARPLWTSADEALWRAQNAKLGPGARKDGADNSTFANPPLYYLYAAIPYWLTSHSGFGTRDHVIRLFNLPFVLAMVVATWLLALELFGPGAIWAATLAAGAVALHPIVASVIGGGVTPDALLGALWAVGLLMAVRLVRRGATVRRTAALLGVGVAAALTQGRGLPLIGVGIVAIGIAVWRARARGWSARTRPAVLGGAAVAVVAVAAAALWYATPR